MNRLPLVMERKRYMSHLLRKEPSSNAAQEVVAIRRALNTAVRHGWCQATNSE